MNAFDKTQEEEAKTWLIEDAAVRNDKAMREVIRYPLLKKQMGLDYLDTSKMEVWDIGAGPLGGVSSILNCRKAIRVEPLTHEYEKYYPCHNYWDKKAEELTEAEIATPDLIIITNALDHFESPSLFLMKMAMHMKPGAYFAHVHAENNAITHKHDAHSHNVNPELFREYLSDDFETVWSLDSKDGLTYGWRKQPAFCGLYRKVTGYSK